MNNPVQGVPPSHGDADIARPGDFTLLAIDTDERAAQPLAKAPDGGDGCAGANFDDHWICHPVQPILHGLHLLLLSLFQPAPVTKHQDIRPGQAAAMRAMGKVTSKQAVFRIDDGFESACRPDCFPATILALQVMDGAMDFTYAIGREPLPRAYFEPASWRLSQHNLQLPAAWRRRPRVR